MIWNTSRCWLTTFHVVDVDPARVRQGWEDIWKKRYTAGIMLLDSEDPHKVIGMSRQPLLAPETD
jgi:beta-1,4-mannooligosaccharide/beta-1,4-mannosyl-N-acetylglucosamine phosphorylase